MQKSQKKGYIGSIGAVDPRSKLRVERVVDKMISTPPSHNDPNGSYTGKPIEYGTIPVQDADDL